MEYICKCSNCDTYLYDENPQTGATKFDPKQFEKVVTMESMNDESGSYYGCGNCQTDSYLIDLEEIHV